MTSNSPWVGHQIIGDRRLGSSGSAGHKKAYVAIDDATGMIYINVLPDEKQATTDGFPLRAAAWFNGKVATCQQVLSDNSSAYRSKPWRKTCLAV